MTHSILNRRVGVIALAAAALMSLPSLASADHVLTSITKQMNCRIRAANEQMNHDVRAVNRWYREALDQARCEVKVARRNACHTERRYVERAYQTRLAEIRCAFKEKLRAVRYQAEVERSAARREFELARRQVRYEREIGVVGTRFVSRHPVDCGCNRCKSTGTNCSSGFCPTTFAPNSVHHDNVPHNSLPPYSLPQNERRFTPSTDPRVIPQTWGERPVRPVNGAPFNQQSPYLAMLQVLMNR